MTNARENFDSECSELAGMLQMYLAECEWGYPASHFAAGYIYQRAKWLAYLAISRQYV